MMANLPALLALASFLCLVKSVYSIPIPTGLDEYSDLQQEKEVCLIEGDIVCPRLASGSRLRAKGVMRAVPVDRNRLWLNRKVALYVDPAYEDTERNIILEAVAKIEEISCLKFDLLESRPKSKRVDYIHVYSKEGCYSDIGRVGGPQLLSLGSSCFYNGIFIPIHEMLHALGIWHEHNRPDRDEYIRVFDQYINPLMKENFALRSPSIADTLGLPYDYYSIMHYGAYDYSIDPANYPTIWPIDPNVDPKEMGQRSRLTDQDIEKLNKLYACDIMECEDPGAPEGGSRQGDDFTVGSTVAFTCDSDDLLLVGSKERFCRFDGKWSGDHIECVQRVHSFCDFETDRCDWEDDETGDFNWGRFRGPASKRDTGPKVDLTVGTTEGHYILMKSLNKDAGQVAKVLSQPLELPPETEKVCLSFGYYMWGETVGSLKAFSRTEDGDDLLWELSGNQGPEWREARASFATPSSNSARILLEGSVGDSMLGDIAVDDFLFKECTSEEAANY